ncbi:alanine--tRNA ligase [Candidatus Uhrbacteria bacterium RIFCSPHIGHO2_02_FULL_57_19]|uniref:Alanine--tRNA ligase n=1 Tax=Candidatus Uhrbacteria bacterium RIFCSPHIGHO2_02_FULL_57_19 TaxID=1802391 RepID=A0A1F7U378_9BACT|nr:MAG: alanine--tRNA ligase [Candidatus Uhrbacteria bacterium RIFCSPHIGHO2_02_FULL_57_19]
MTGHQLRKKFLDFFVSKGHAVIPSSSIVPEHDPTVLFTTAGMHPLVPYLLGESHPAGGRLADSQKCLRTDDIEEVGDESHLTFFEMLGNWSLGDYFKKESIPWSFEFLTDKKWLGVDPKKMYVTVFAGDADAPFDEESVEIWKAEFKKKKIGAELSKKHDIGSGGRIFAYGKEQNWWGPAGQTGPCGPDTEIFYDTGKEHDSKRGTACHPNCSCGRFVEIWNNVFMQYNRKAVEEKGYRFEPLEQKNVDTGMGLERITAVLQKVSDVFRTDLFEPIIRKVEAITGRKYGENGDDTRKMRIIADHLRAATFILGDDWGVTPSNKDQGYICRRLIRRAVVQAWLLDVFRPFASDVANEVIIAYSSAYPELQKNKKRILEELVIEEEKFQKTLERGIKMIGEIASRGEKTLSGQRAFELYATYGFPLEIAREILSVKTGGAVSVDEEAYRRELEKHQDISRAGSVGKFAGGLADHTIEVVRGHTATHLLHQALKTVLGSEVEQRGSNITAERLRFDFSWPAKPSTEQIKAVENLVNEQIGMNLPVRFEILDVEQARQTGALGYFEDKYASLGGKIKVYLVGDDQRGYFSKEICGGPHVSRTGELGGFKILKEEAVSAGVRRIKATIGAPKE